MSCERGVWEQAFTAEHARIANTCAGTGLLDLAKAYERVLYGHLIDAAQMTNFPLDILRLLLCVYRCPRLLVVGQVASAPVMTEQTIVAGCAFATTLLKMLLIRMLDCVTAKFPFARVYNVVEDITVRVRGSRKFVRDMLPIVVGFTCRMLEELDLVLARAKGKIVSTRQDVVQSSERALA
eukprot:883126-Pyramimonas_sp.AAC.1